VKVYLSSGRFVAVDDAGAVYAVPDRGLLTRAETNRTEVEAALAAYFGRPVPLRLVLDEVAAAGTVGAAGSGAVAGARGAGGPGGPGSPGAAGPVDTASRADGSPSPAVLPDDPGGIDLDELIDAPGAVLSPEQRLLEAFPGAEEVSP
jgi:hypothetical protein